MPNPIQIKKSIWTQIFSLILVLATVLPAFAQNGSDETPNFVFVVGEKLRQNGRNLYDFCPIDNLAAKRVFEDYGAIFVSNNRLGLPTTCMFESETDVSYFQSVSKPRTERIGGVSITLQEPAMEALIEARKQAAQAGLSITPRGTSIAGSRSFADTYRLWISRFNPGLNRWVSRGKISRADADKARKLGIRDQVAQVLRWEEDGLYFSTGFDKSILYSVAAPGASQHVFMLALDVQQFGNKRVRDILADNGWFQTVKSDLPHFTFLGVDESELPKLGLKPEIFNNQKFWIPNV